MLTDNQGVPLACSEAIGGNHNDAYNLENNVEEMRANNLQIKNINRRSISKCRFRV